MGVRHHVSGKEQLAGFLDQVGEDSIHLLVAKTFVAVAVGAAVVEGADRRGSVSQPVLPAPCQISLDPLLAHGDGSLRAAADEDQPLGEGK